MGRFDRLFRLLVVAPVLMVIAFAGFGIGNVFGILALLFAGVMLATAAVGFCPAYTLFGISTRGHFEIGGRGRPVAHH